MRYMGRLLGSCVTNVVHTTKVSKVENVLHGDK